MLVKVGTNQILLFPLNCFNFDEQAGIAVVRTGPDSPKNSRYRDILGVPIHTKIEGPNLQEKDGNRS